MHACIWPQHLGNAFYVYSNTLLDLRNHEFSNFKEQPQEAKHLQELATILYCGMEKNQERRRHIGTRNDAKCSEVITALKPTTGTNAARSVPSITCKMIHESGKLQFWTNTLERRVCQQEEAYALTRGAYAM